MPTSAPAKAAVARMDLTRVPAASTADELCHRPGRLDMLVDDAGTGTMTPFLDLELGTVR